MKSITKFAAAAAVLSSTLLYGAEVIKFSPKTDFDSTMRFKGVTVTFAEDSIQCSGRAMLLTKKAIDIDPSKKYTLKMTVVNNSDKPSRVYAGYAMRNSKDGGTDALHWQGYADTLTTLVADAAKGAKELKVKDGSKWRKHAACVIIANAKADHSDIPNYNWVANNIESAQQDGDAWILKLKSPLRRTLKAGTVIRQHFRGGYLYINSPKNIPAKGQIVIQGSLKGLATQPGPLYNSSKWPINAKKARVVILADWSGANNASTIKDISITVE